MVTYKSFHVYVLSFLVKKSHRVDAVIAAFRFNFDGKYFVYTRFSCICLSTYT